MLNIRPKDGCTRAAAVWDTRRAPHGSETGYTNCKIEFLFAERMGNMILGKCARNHALLYGRYALRAQHLPALFSIHCSLGKSSVVVRPSVGLLVHEFNTIYLHICSYVYV